MNDGEGPINTPFAESIPDKAKQRFVDWVRKHPEGFADPPAVVLVSLVIAILMASTIVLIPRTIKGVRAIWRSVKLRRVLEDFCDDAVPVMAYPLMVNSDLRRPGTNPLPGLALAVFEPDMTIAQSVGIVERIEDAERTPGHPARVAIRKIFKDEQFRHARRRPVPECISNGAAVFICDIIMHPLCFSQGYLHDDLPFVPCLAEPGEKGRIMQLPHWVLTDDEPTAEQDKALSQVALLSLFPL